MEREGMQQRVQIAILREINDQRSVGWPTMSLICPGSDERDYLRALDLLVSAGAVQAFRWGRGCESWRRPVA
jgi:hypothetical protein